MSIIIYGADNCPKCNELKKWMDEQKIPYDYREVDADIVTELRVDGVFERELPILKVVNRYYTPRNLWSILGFMNKELLESIFRVGGA